MKIVKGKQRQAVRAVFYGPEGIGKSTLAAQFPRPLVLDTEDGTGQIDCDRVLCDEWSALEGALHDLIRDRHGYETVVIDSADWAERQVIAHLLDKSKKKSIEDFGFGKGYTMVAEHVGRLLAVADQLVGLGTHVVFVAHCKVQRVAPPDMDEGFDRYELKLSKQVSPLFKEWCDLLAFMTYRTTTVEGADGRVRGRGGKDRVMHVERSAAWDAKNRFGLASPLPMSIDSLASIFDKRTGASSSPVVHPARPAAQAAAPGPLVEPLREQIAAYIGKATNQRTLTSIGARLQSLLTEQQITEDEWHELCGLLNDKASEIGCPQVAAS